MAQPKQPTASWFQAEILKSLQEVKDKVDESLDLGRQNGEDIRSLRKELGVDGLHGRIPQLEQAIARLDRQQENDHKELLERIEASAKKSHDDKNKLDARLIALEHGTSENRGGKRVVNGIISFFSGSLGAALVGLGAKAMGLIH